jgi:secondary thiamine-phosphate synthase enzyme
MSDFLINISSSEQYQLINITDKVLDCVNKSKVKNGLLFLFVAHSTCSFITNEDEEGVKADVLERIKALAPPKNYQHNCINHNAQAHVIASILGPSLTFPIKNGEIIRGTWQEIFFVELDGPRDSRKIVVKII